MLRSHHHLRGFITQVLWDVYCVNGCWSSRLGYVGFEGNCDCRYGVLYAPMLGGGYVGYSGIQDTIPTVTVSFKPYTYITQPDRPASIHTIN